MKRVLVLQNIWDDPPGYLGEILQEHGIPYDTINAEKEPLPDLINYDALIILGGPQNANAEDKYPYLAREKELLRQAVEQDIPSLGICLGGQLLASALGARVTRHSMTEIGFYRVQLTDEGKRDFLFQDLPDYQLVMHWHEDTFDIPEGAMRLATNENTFNQAFRFGRHAYGLQYHIELTPELLDIWLHDPDCRNAMIRSMGVDAPELIEQSRSCCYPLYRQHSRTMFENFLKLSGCL